MRISEQVAATGGYRDPRLCLIALEFAGRYVSQPAPEFFAGWPGNQFLFGGIVLGGCIAALETTFGRPVAFASAQFLSTAKPGEDLRFEVEGITDGGKLCQAAVHGFAGERRFVSVQGAVGQRENIHEWQGPAMPAVEAPDACRAVSMARLLSSNLHALYELRLAVGSLPDRADWRGAGRESLCVWARPRDGSAIDRSVLAMFGDFLAIALPGALGQAASATSLDNHIRFIGAPQGDWVLCAMEIEGAHNGLVHGQMRLFSSDGQLMAIASQSMILRL